MTLLAPHLATFFREYLPRERACSQHTCDAYAYTFQLLLCFAAQRCHTSPSSLTLEQLDAPLVLAFLEHIETVRGNSPTTRNARLAAIKSFAHVMEYRVPSAIEQRRRLLAIPAKKTDQALVDYLPPRSSTASSMLQTQGPVAERAIGPCSTSALLRDCGSLSASGCGSMTYRRTLRRPFTSVARAAESVSCRYGRRPPPRFGPGSPYEGRVLFPRCFSTRVRGR